MAYTIWPMDYMAHSLWPIAYVIYFDNLNNRLFRSMESILKAINEHSVGRIITMSSWYCQSRGESLGGCFGCMATFFLRHMIGHVLIDMEKMYKILEEKSNKELQWQVICFPCE